MQKALSDKVNQPASQDAYVFAQVEQASTYLHKEDLPAARKLLDECERLLDTFDFVETIVHAKFYRENAAYYKVCIDTISYRIIIGLTKIGNPRLRRLLQERPSLPRLCRARRPHLERPSE